MSPPGMTHSSASQGPSITATSCCRACFGCSTPSRGSACWTSHAGRASFAVCCGKKEVETTGIDAAKELIAAAKEKGAGDYRVGDARDLSPLPAVHFDAAACVLAIQNIHPIRPVFESVARCLRPLGRFVVVMMHPAFRGAKESHWGWDEASKVQFRRVDRYLIPRKSPIVAHPGQKESEYTWTFHKPIEAYVKAARQAGLLIDALEEWPSHKTSQPGPRQAAENQSRKEIPMFLAIRCVKVTETGRSDD